MTLFHIPTLLLTLSLLYFIMPAVTYLVLEDRRMGPVTLWCSGDVVLGVAMLLFSLRGQVPEWATYPLANLLMFAAAMMRIQSLRCDLTRPWPLAGIVAATLVFVLGFEGIRLGLHDDLLRMQYHHFVFEVLFFYLATLAWRLGRREQSRGAYWIAGGYVLVAVAMLSNLIGISLGRTTTSLLDSNATRVFALLAAIFNAVVSNIGYVGLAFERSRRQALQADQEYRDIIATSLDGFFIGDRDGRLTDVNPAFCDMTGYRREELLTLRIADIANDDARDRDAPRGRHRWEARADRFETRLRRKDGQVFDVEAGTQFLPIGTGRIVAFIHDISARKRAEAEIRTLAFYDPLTQLPNRRLLKDRMRQALVAGKRSGGYGALLLLDLDNFKPLNDGYGHAVGDLLLIEVARRISLGRRAHDTVARLGGDEFVLLISDLSPDADTAAKQAARVAEQTRIALSAPYRLTVAHEGRAGAVIEYHCTASLGVSLFTGNAETEEAIFRKADMAMYQAKEDGRGRARLYTSEPVRNACDRVYSFARRAIADNHPGGAAPALRDSLPS